MNPEESSAHPFVALFCAGIGLFILLVAAGVIPTDPGSIHAPRWVLGLCGVVFAAGGVAILGPRFALLRNIGLSALLLAMGGVAFWAAALAPVEGWSGGIPLVPRAVNVWFARGLAGFGVLLCLGLLVHGWKTGFRSAGDASRHGRSGP